MAAKHLSTQEDVGVASSIQLGRISELTDDCIQEEKIRITCMREGRSVEYALECEPDYDIEKAVIDAALDDQVADLDYLHKLDVLLISIDETS